MPQAMKIPDAEAAVDKGWKSSRQSSMGHEKSHKKEVLEAQRDNMRVHFVSLMDIYHLKNAESKLQRYKGRVVLRGDIVKNDSGAYAVFAEKRLICISVICCKNHGLYQVVMTSS